MSIYFNVTRVVKSQKTPNQSQIHSYDFTTIKNLTKNLVWQDFHLFSSKSYKVTKRKSELGEKIVPFISWFKETSQFREVLSPQSGKIVGLTKRSLTPVISHQKKENYWKSKKYHKNLIHHSMIPPFLCVGGKNFGKWLTLFRGGCALRAHPS